MGELQISKSGEIVNKEIGFSNLMLLHITSKYCFNLPMRHYHILLNINCQNS